MVDPPNITGQPRQTPPDARIFARQFTAGDMATRTVLADIVAMLADAGISGDDLATIELILAEALNNVVEHAYAEGAGPVELLLELRRRGLVCQIIDTGRPMPTGDAPDPPLPEIKPPVDIPEGGFGWHIIRCLTKDLTYQRDGARNTLSMLVPLTAAE